MPLAGPRCFVVKLVGHVAQVLVLRPFSMQKISGAYFTHHHDRWWPHCCCFDLLISGTDPSYAGPRLG